MSDDKRRRQEFKPEDPLAEGFEQGLAQFGLDSLTAERLRHTLEHLDQVGARAAARVENHNILVSKAKRASELALEDLVDAPNLIPDHLRGRIPDPEFFPKLGVESLQEGFVEIDDGGRNVSLSVDLWAEASSPSRTD